MLRTRKKDINLKPNRILDKRSSRGMLYENEELRLRTIHINDEVDKGHNSIKKLKKENEQLKRELWCLRDECEKLEKMLNKVCKAIEDKGTLEGLGLSPETQRSLFDFPAIHRSHTALRRESVFTQKSYGESEEDGEEAESPNDNTEALAIEPTNQIEEGQEEAGCSKTTESQFPLVFCPEISSEPYENLPESPSSPLLPPTIEITPAPGVIVGSTESPNFQNSPSIPVEVKENIEGIEECQRIYTEQQLSSSRAETNTLQRRRGFGEKTGILKKFDFLSVSKSVPNLRVIYEDNAAGHLNLQNSKYTSNNIAVSEWDPNVLIGYIETGNGVSGKNYYKLTDFRAEELIDELEFELGSKGLAQVKSIRLMLSHCPGTLFMSFRTSESFRPLAEKGIMNLRNGDIRIKLQDASKKWSFVHLFSIPPQIPDADVIRVLNQFGQVVAPVERSCYKGVDISERLVRMYLCRKVPQILNIGGYECPAKISSQGQVPCTSSVPCSPITPPISVSHTVRDGEEVFQVFRFDRSPVLKDAMVQKFRKRADTLPLKEIPDTSEKKTSCPCLAGTNMTLPNNSNQSGNLGSFTNFKPRTSPTTPPANEVSFYRSVSSSHDTRRRSSASRFHLTNAMRRDIEDDLTQSDDNLTQSYQTSKNISSRLGLQRPNRRKHLPWFSCLGNGCI